MQKTRDHPNSRSGYVKEDVLKAISGFFIILAFIAVISLFAGMGGSSGGTSNSGSSDSKVIFVVNDMLLEAPKDTTWEEFVSNESINTLGFTIVDGNVYLGDSKVIDSETNLPVTPDMPIDSNIEYKDESYMGGSGSGSGDSDDTEEESEIPNDLRGYTVTVPAGLSATEGWTATAGYGVFSVEGTFSDPTYGDNPFTSLYVGYALNFETFEYEMSPNAIVYGGYATTFPNGNSLSFSITGGDTDNSSLIQWLYDNNATFEKTVTTPLLISFTINGQEYLAEEGMTWFEWCDTDYNTGGWFATEFSVSNGAMALSDVVGNDEIIEGYNYTFNSGGY